MGRLPLDHLPRRRRRGDRQPQRAADDAVLPRGRRRGEGQLPRARGDRRRDRGARPGAQLPGVRGAPAAHPPRREPGEPPGGGDPRELRRVRPAGRGRRGPHREAVPRAPGPARGGAGQGGPAGAPHADHRRPRHRGGVVRPVRGGRAGRAHRQGPRGHLPARQARDDQGEARAHGRLRGRGLPGAQVRAGRDRVAAARALPGRRQAGLRRRDRRVPDADAPGAHAGDAAAGHDVRRPPVGVGTSGRGRPHAAQGRGQPVERQQGPLVRTAPARAGRGGPLRLHGGRPLPAHRPVRAVAARPRAVLLHVRAAGAAGHVRPGRGPRPRLRWRRAGRRRRRSPGRGCRARCRRCPPFPPVARTRPAACGARRPTRCPAWG